MPDRDASDRLDVLEMRVAHQDRVIDDLNATITAQWSRIETLVRQVAVLGDRLRETESRTAAAASVQPPPHY